MALRAAYRLPICAAPACRRPGAFADKSVVDEPQQYLSDSYTPAFVVIMISKAAPIARLPTYAGFQLVLVSTQPPAQFVIARNLHMIVKQFRGLT